VHHKLYVIHLTVLLHGSQPMRSKQVQPVEERTVFNHTP